jgi:hypothetical protein
MDCVWTAYGLRMIFAKERKNWKELCYQTRLHIATEISRWDIVF